MTHIAVVHSLFDTDSLRDVITSRYGIGPVSSFALHRSYVNDVYRIETGTGAMFFLKIARHTWRQADDVAWDVALQRHLLQHHVSVAEPIPQRDGEPVCVLDAPEGPRAAVLYRATRGTKPEPPFLPDLYEQVGAAAARMHNALDRFDLPPPRPGRNVSWLIERSGELIAKSLEPDHPDRTFVEGFSAGLAADVHARSPALDWGICHGDLTLDNLTVAVDGTISFFDFDLAAPAWRASEPSGIYTWSMEDPAARPLWRAYLAGYRSERAFSNDNEATIPHFAAACELWDLAHEIEHWRKWSGDWRTTPEIIAERIARLRVWAHRLTLPPP